MLGKLIKYDFKSISKTLVPIFIVTLILSVLTRIFGMLADEISVFQYPAGLVTALCVALILGLPFITFIIGIMRYYNNLVKDEGYLTHTLPVKKQSLVLSKMITSSIGVLVSLLISIGSVFIAFNIDFKIFDAFVEAYNDIMEYDKWLLLLIFIALIVGYLSNLLLVYSSISLGQTRNGNKALYSIIFGIVIYNITQVVCAILLVAPSIGNKNYLTYLDQDKPPVDFINGFMVYAIIISIITCFIYYFITVRTMTKKLNLD